MEDLRAARRYAAALFRVSLERNLLQESCDDLQGICELMEKSPPFRRYLESPVVPVAKKKQMLEEKLGPHLSSTFLTFLKLLVDKRRVDCLPAILRHYVDLCNQYAGVIEAEVTTAVALLPEERWEMIDRLGQMTGRTIKLKERVDPSIIGGAVIAYGDRLMDGSVATYLQNLRQRFHETKVV